MNRKILSLLGIIYALIWANPLSVSAQEMQETWIQEEIVRSDVVFAAGDITISEEDIVILEDPVKVTNYMYTNKGVTIKWDKYKREDLVGYLVYRYEYNYETELFEQETYVYDAIDADKTSYLDTSVENGKYYCYAVLAVAGTEDGTEIYISNIAEESYAYVFTLETPDAELSNTSGGIKLEWDKVPGADGYAIYRRKSGGKWTNEPYKVIYDADKLSYINTAVTAGQGYYYRVTAFMDDPAHSEYIWETDYTDDEYIRRLKRPNVTVTNCKSSIKVAWKKISGATGYQIYRNGKLVKTTKSLYWYDYNKTNGTKYQYTVKAYYKGGSGKKYYSALSVKDTIYRLTRPTINSLTKGNRRFTVKYAKNSKATGYQITYSRYSSFKKSTSIRTTSRSKTISGLTKGKTYYVKVRSYKTVNGIRYYSQYSPVKKITTK